MSVPKRKGYRGITVSNRRFRWRFEERIIVVADGAAGRQVLEVDFGWFDHWLYANEGSNLPSQFSPRVATPAFVSSAIEFALKHGWNTEVRGGRFLLKYNAEQGFHVPAEP